MSVQDVEEPEIVQPSQILIEVRAASLDPVDLKVQLISVDIKLTSSLSQGSLDICANIFNRSGCLFFFFKKSKYFLNSIVLMQKLWIVLYRCLRVMGGGLGSW